jgi:hypothetical protein
MVNLYSLSSNLLYVLAKAFTKESNQRFLSDQYSIILPLKAGVYGSAWASTAPCRASTRWKGEGLIWKPSLERDIVQTNLQKQWKIYAQTKLKQRDYISSSEDQSRKAQKNS